MDHCTASTLAGHPPHTAPAPDDRTRARPPRWAATDRHEWVAWTAVLDLVAELISEMIRSCPSVVILTTSREVPTRSGELIFGVRSAGFVWRCLGYVYG
jgi:hypothetical protein